MRGLAYWECPVCAWAILDIEYLTLIVDPDCPGCGVRKWSEFQYKDVPKRIGLN